MADDLGLGRYDPRGSGEADMYSTVNTTIQWEDRVRTLKEIVQGGKFPCLVKANKADVQKYCPDDARANTNDTSHDETLHVLELRRHKMVVALKMQWDRRTGDYQETGKQIEIDVTQKGWFEVLPENGQPVEYFDTIHAIVGIKPKQFLVRTSIVGYQLSVENGDSCWMPWEIRPGEILTTGIVHMDHKKTKKKTFLRRIFSSSKNGSKREQELKYLQCFDSKEREIMVPLIMTGVFSPVGDPGNPDYDAVYNIHDLLSAFQLPIKAQLVQTDSRNTEKLPSGVLIFERLKDKEMVLVAKHPYMESEDQKFEIPLNDEFPVVREKRKKIQKQQKVELQNTVNYENAMEDPYSVPQSNQIDLPIRVKDSKKSKGTALLEKLSVRSKGKKERASLKALQEQGVFSSRLSKSEINFDDLCNPANDESNATSDVSDTTDASVHIASTAPIKSKRDIDLENGYSVSIKHYNMQERDLPPIPVKTRSPRLANSPNKDSVYEELPVAPRPPVSVYTNTNSYEHHTDMADDGYMTPAKFREMNDYDGREFDVIKSKPPTAPRDSLRYTRARKVKSEYIQQPPIFDDDPGESIDEMFDFTNNDEVGYSSSQYERRKQNPNYIHPKYQTKRDTYQLQRQLSAEDGRRFIDDSALEAKSTSGFSKMKSRSHKNLNIESNATIRSHNVRKMRTAMDVFNFNDSLRDLRQPFQNGVEAPPEPMYGRIVDNERIQSYVYNQQNPYGKVGNQHYVESEPAYRRYHRSSSTAALSDMFPSRGDDSAISCGEYGFQGESEYSYSEYSKWQDDKWVPPDDIEGLSVLEVSKSLRYIGMKDRVIIRFSNEQIDGNLLCTLDKKLLKEGFPELNALEIKKILDFVGGWRPKK